MSTLKYPKIRNIVGSTYLDFIGIGLILSVVIYRKFHETIYLDGDIVFNIPLSEQWEMLGNGAYPLGIMSVIGAVFSMLATRFVSKQNNSGNVLGVITTVNSGSIDFMFGNASSIITYPVTFIIHMLAVKNWAKGQQIRKKDKYYYLIIILGLITGTTLVYAGAKLFGGRTDSNFLMIVSITYGLSLGATVCNIFKYQETWLSWIFYNVVQLIKNSMQANLANVVKYIFYLFHAIITLVDWKFNGDEVEKTSNSELEK